jgi:PEP-CTERM putative exosortase interaction domain
VGFIVSEPGALLLLITGILIWVSARRGRLMLAVPVLAGIYVVALGVAWVAMSGKP